MYKTKGTERPQRPKPPKKAVARRGAPQEGGPLAVGQRVRVVRDGKVCDGDVSFLSPLGTEEILYPPGTYFELRSEKGDVALMLETEQAGRRTEVKLTHIEVGPQLPAQHML